MTKRIANGLLRITEFNEIVETLKWIDEKIKIGIRRPAVQAHVTENPQSKEDVRKIQDSYIDYLYECSPSLKRYTKDFIRNLSNQEIRDLTYR